MLSPIRHLALVSGILQLGACTTWQLATDPARTVIQEQAPSEIRITTLDEDRVVLRDPIMSGDSIAGRVPEDGGASVRTIRFALSDLVKIETTGPPSEAALSTDSLWIGSRVRVESFRQGTLYGEIRGISTDELTLRLRTGVRHSVPWADASRLEVGIRQGSNTRKGALWGLGLGSAVAAIVALTTGSDDFDPGFVFAVGVAYFGLPAAGFGALVGSQIPNEQWRDLPIPPPHR